MKRFFASIAAIAAVAAAALAQTQLPNDETIRIGKLDNGMTYYIRHNDIPAERAEFYLATNVGAFQETDEQDGLAHFLEHMCFNGTKNFPGKNLLTYLQGIGAQFGRNINASTGYEQTTYMLNNIPVTREGIIDTCLLVMHDYSHFVTLNQDEIDAERGVINEERRQTRTAGRRAGQEMLSFLFKGTPNADRTLIGTEEQLLTFERQSLVDFYTTWYQPDMQAIIVVGDIDPDQIEAKIRSTFADVPAPATPTTKTSYPMPDNDTPVVGFCTDPELMATQIIALWKSEPIPQELNSTDAGFFLRLIKRLTETVINERIDDIKSQAESPIIEGEFDFARYSYTTSTVEIAAVARDEEPLKAFEAIMTEAERLRRHGLTYSELERAKTKVIAALEKAAEAADGRKNPEFIRPILNNFFYGLSIFDPETELMMAKAICSQITPQMINMVAQRFITDENLAVFFIGPEREGLATPTEQELLDIIAKTRAADIAPIAEEGADEPLLDPDELAGAAASQPVQAIYGSTEYSLPNGAKVVILTTDYKKDEVNVWLTKSGGRSIIATDDLTSLDDDLWELYVDNKGVASFSGTKLKKMLSGKNVTCSPFLSDFRHGIMASSTPKDVETALQLLYLNMTAQRFDPDEYQIGVTQLEAILPNLANNPDFAAYKRYIELLYNGNPRTAIIDEESLKKADVTTLERVYGSLFNGVDGAVIYIVGNITAQEVMPLVEKYIGSIPAGTATSWIDPQENTVKGQVSLRDSFAMEIPKAEVYQLYTAEMPYTVAAEVNLDIIEYVLRMVYVSTLRESESGTYSPQVYTSHDIEPVNEASIMVSFPTNADMAEYLAKMAKDELTKLAQEGFSDEQMAQATENLKKTIPERRITNSYWLRALRFWHNYGIDFDTQYEAAVAAATAQSVTEFLRELLAADNCFEFVALPAQ